MGIKALAKGAALLLLAMALSVTGGTALALEADAGPALEGAPAAADALKQTGEALTPQCRDGTQTRLVAAASCKQNMCFCEQCCSLTS